MSRERETPEKEKMTHVHLAFEIFECHRRDKELLILRPRPERGETLRTDIGEDSPLTSKTTAQRDKEDIF
jgi:hypothetical protein